MRAAAVILAATLGACSGEEVVPDPARPVLSVVVEPAGHAAQAFAGTVEPRYETERGFEVLGRIETFAVDIGDIVATGQTLATLDPTPLALEVRSREGDLAQARARAENAEAQRGRTERLVQRDVEPQAELDADIRDRDAAVAAVRQAEAELAKAREALGYATMTADGDGVVTAKDADVGETVDAGERVMTLARLDVREAVVDLPEEVAAAVRRGTPFRVVLQVNPGVVAEGTVREIAPQADAATRTRRVRITLSDPPDAFRLGTTVTAIAEGLATDDAAIVVPRAALRDGAVFVVDAAAKAVRLVPVTVGEATGDGFRVTGLTVGQRVVVAGVNGLEDGETIRIEEDGQ